MSIVLDDYADVGDEGVLEVPQSIELTDVAPGEYTFTDDPDPNGFALRDIECTRRDA